MSGGIELSVVIPAYLEAENLLIILPRLKDTLDRMGASYEILIVDTDPPKDATGDVCARYGARHLLRVGGEHYGAAVSTGIREARGAHILFMDADGSHAPEFIPKLWAHAAEHDIVIASRYVDGGVTENPLVLQWMSRLLNVLYRVVLGLDCLDVSNSFKVYRAAGIRSLTLECKNFDIVEEILVRYQGDGKVRIKEVPFAFKKRLFGETKRNLITFIFTFAVTLARLRLLQLRSRRRA